jgi:hypothetical protein
MRKRTAAVALPIAIIVMSLLSASSGRQANPLEVHVRKEVSRLQAHFDSVDAEMQARNTAHLTPEQRASRAQLIQWLRDYRRAATFPLNDGVSSGAVPIFRDSRGVLCAMAYLIHRSGRADLGDDISAHRNTAYVTELADDARLVAWIDSTGLTVAEAARIQPTYGRARTSDVAGDYAIASVLLGGGAMATVGVNLISPSQLSGVFGIIAGTFALLNGVTRLDDAHSTHQLASINTGVGALTMAVSLRGIFTRGSPAYVARSSARFADVTLGPATVASLGSPRLGVALRARF